MTRYSVDPDRREPIASWGHRRGRPLHSHRHPAQRCGHRWAAGPGPLAHPPVAWSNPPTAPAAPCATSTTRPSPTRSAPRHVRREIYGYLLAHYALSALICRAVTNAGIDPDRVKFTRTLRLIRRHVTATPAAFSP